MKQTLLKFTSLTALSCIHLSCLYAGTASDATISELPYLSVVIDKVDYYHNRITLYGLNYCYTHNTLILNANNSKVTEYELSHGTPVHLITKDRKGLPDDCVKGLSKIIIRKSP
jgi:hypothetical protein